MKTSERTVVLPASVRFAFLIGLLLLVGGICELFRPVVFGLPSNPLHGLIHLGLAITAIWAGRTGRSRGFLVLLGLFFTLVSVLWHFPGTNAFMVRSLNMNNAVAYAHGFVGVLALVIAIGTSSPR